MPMENFAKTVVKSFTCFWCPSEEIIAKSSIPYVFVKAFHSFSSYVSVFDNSELIFTYGIK